MKINIYSQTLDLVNSMSVHFLKSKKWSQKKTIVSVNRKQLGNVMREFIYDTWNGVMNSNVNPLRHIDDLQVRHLVLQVLAWMWCIVFAFLVGSWTVFGISAVAHLIFIAAIVVTVGTFATARAAPQSFNFMKGWGSYHSLGRSRNAIWVDGKKIDLPKGDPGGEHE